MGKAKKDEKLTEEQAKFAEANYGLVHKYLHENKLYPLDDFEGICAIGYCKAIQKYDESKGIFSNYAYLWMKGVVNQYQRDQYKRNGFDWSMIRLDDLTGEDEQGERIEIIGKTDDGIDSFPLMIDFKDIFQGLPDRARNVIELKYLGLTQQQIADRLGTTQMTISRDLKKVAEKLCA